MYIVSHASLLFRLCAPEDDTWKGTFEFPRINDLYTGRLEERYNSFPFLSQFHFFTVLASYLNILARFIHTHIILYHTASGYEQRYGYGVAHGYDLSTTDSAVTFRQLLKFDFHSRQPAYLVDLNGQGGEATFVPKPGAGTTSQYHLL